MGLVVRLPPVFAGFLVLAGCSAPVPQASTPATPTRSFGLALESHPCVAGSNTVSAAAFVASGGGNHVRYLTPRDGQLRVRLLERDGSSRPVEVRWLVVSDEKVNQELAKLRWNIQLRFESSRMGACPVRIEFQPAPAGASAGLRPALTTVVLQAPPLPPGFVPNAK
jgi:hypothetical protein